VRDPVARGDDLRVLVAEVGKRGPVELDEPTDPVGTRWDVGRGRVVVLVLGVDERVDGVEVSLVEDLREEPPDERLVVYSPFSSAALYAIWSESEIVSAVRTNPASRVARGAATWPSP
jgi:hypothetical protein